VNNVKRNTVQRQIVLEAIKRLNTHPTIEEIYDELHNGHPSISKTTVYRNLRQLADNGIIRKVSLPDGLERYDRNTEPHYHFKCEACGNIYDVIVGYLTDLNDMVKEKYGYRVERHDVVFSGVCLECANSAAEPKVAPHSIL